MAGLRRTATRFRAIRLVVGQLGAFVLVLFYIEVVLVVAGPLEPAWVVALFPCLAVVYVTAGVVAWVRRPSNRIGALLVAGGFAWFIAGLANTEQPQLIVLGQIGATVPLAVIVHLLLAFPSGQLRERSSRLIVAAGYVTATMLQTPLYLFTPEAPPYDTLQVADRPDLADVGVWVQRSAGMAVMVAASGVLGRRLWVASPAQRGVLAPLYGYGIAAVLFVPLSFNVIRPLLDLSVLTTIVAQVIVLGLVPLAFAFGILRGGFGRTAEVDELGSWLGTDEGGRPGLRDALTDALGDPSIRLAFRSPDRGGYVDAEGRPVAFPPTGDSRAAVEIQLGGNTVGAVEYDASLIPESELVREAGRVVALALDRERLTANLLASQRALRESRLRIVDAADRERHRIARDLHDGLQTTLLLVAIQASQMGASELRAALDNAIDELRWLVHGVIPPVLIELGLFAAVEDLVDRLPIPARLDIAGGAVRLPQSIEHSAYFVVAEAVTNAVKHSRARELAVGLRRDADTLRIDVADDGVGGAVPSGTGLRGIADRVDVLGGHLRIDSPPGGGTRVVAEVPCGS